MRTNQTETIINIIYMVKMPSKDLCDWPDDRVFGCLFLRVGLETRIKNEKIVSVTKEIDSHWLTGKSLFAETYYHVLVPELVIGPQTSEIDCSEENFLISAEFQA